MNRSIWIRFPLEIFCFQNESSKLLREKVGPTVEKTKNFTVFFGMKTNLNATLMSKKVMFVLDKTSKFSHPIYTLQQDKSNQ